MEFLKKTKTNKKLSASSYSLKINEGFTLIEVLVSLAMIVILTGITLQMVRFSDTKKSLIIERDRFRSVIREAQNNSLAIPNENSEHICGFGVNVDSSGNSYRLFYTSANIWDVPETACEKCLSYNCWEKEECSGGIIDADVVLPDGISFTEGESVFFSVPYGDVIIPGYFQLTQGTDNISVNVNGFGKIE
jgi:prepilin-type N-terminal cleavage/methylation domain-containing protein